MTEFGPLYKKTSTGAIQLWKIEVEGNILTTTFGQLHGKMQTTTDTIKSGKNVGRLNETTPEEQALAEAKSQWEKKLKSKGYCSTIDGARGGEKDERVKGGVDVLLAHNFEDHSAKVEYPVMVSRKIDGVRCVAIIKGGECTLWSRTRKPITAVPHVAEALKKMFHQSKVVLIFDGELYVHGMPFEDLIHLCRPVDPPEGHEQVEYHIFDLVVATIPFFDRYNVFKRHFENAGHPLMLVENTLVGTEEEMYDLVAQFTDEKYEGGMVRDPKAAYVGKRSRSLLKVKTMQDAEYPIVGVEEGRGKLQGHVGAFVCTTPEGKQFSVKMRGELENLRQYWEHPVLWKGQLLVVQFQNLTEDGKPRFPVGLRFRDPIEG